jgi:copper(I)-binding protein
MSRHTRRLLLGAAAALILAPRARAHSYTAGDLEIGHPWSRATGTATPGAAFLTIRNTGTLPDRLLAARGAVARTIELHTHIREGEVMRMRPVADIPVPPGETVRLQPGGLHIMLIGLAEPLRQGSRVPLTLVFERAGEVRVELAVEAAGAGGGGHAH